MQYILVFAHWYVPKYVLNLLHQDEEFEEILPEESNADDINMDNKNSW